MDKQVVQLVDAFVIQDNLVRVLSNVNLAVQAGEFAYIIGKTGSGKSSLLKTIYADLPLKEGEGEVAGYKLTGIKKEDG